MRLLVRVLPVAALLTALYFAWPRSPAVGQGVLAPDTAPAARYVGAASCASMACHNANGLKGSPRSEYTTWATYDKHARAFAALETDRSATMIRNLYGADSKPATQTALCLKCHATNNGEQTNTGPRFQLADGVSCEACHGPAEKWLSAHYQAGFKEKSIQTKFKEYGLWPTKQLAFRARLCTECHVGDGSREVNHDLIAAGHPRLSFELGGYHGIAAKHWRDPDPQTEVKLWTLGQLLAARAALDLLHTRAEGAGKEGSASRPWPEFAEHDCFACHKNLQVESPRQRTWKAEDKPGTLPWGSWYFSMTRPFARQTGGEALKLEAALERIKALMQRPAPDAAGVAVEAKAALKLLDDWIQQEEKKQYTGAEAKALFRAFLDAQMKNANALDWDQATQLYLALAALHQGMKDLGEQPADPTALSNDLRSVSQRLRTAFPRGSDSPSLFDPTARPDLAEQLKSIRTHLGN